MTTPTAPVPDSALTAEVRAAQLRVDASNAELLEARSAAAKQIAALALSRSDEVLARLDGLSVGVRDMQEAARTSAGAIARIELAATSTLVESKRTNGRITLLEQWKTKLEGITIGAGGVGTVMTHTLAAGVSAGGVIGLIYAAVRHFHW